MINKAKEHLQSFGENVIENLTNNETISNAFNNAAKETFDKTQVINTDEVNSKASPTTPAKPDTLITASAKNL